ncbi:MAG: transposase [Candidatus Moraniibacteriota bacterium]
MKNKIRKPNRYSGHDYSLPGFYFVTICTDEMKEYFGKVEKGEIKLNQLGKITENYWSEIPKHFQEIELEEFIVMPNHIHGIINIVADAYTRPDGTEAAYMRPLQSDRSKMLLSKIIQGYKAAVSREAKRKFNISFRWQRSFYDRVIRTQDSLNKIRQYIERNPKFWDEDKNKVENIFY